MYFFIRIYFPLLINYIFFLALKQSLFRSPEGIFRSVIYKYLMRGTWQWGIISERNLGLNYGNIGVVYVHLMRALMSKIPDKNKSRIILWNC